MKIISFYIKLLIIISLVFSSIFFGIGCSGKSNGSSSKDGGNVWTKKPFKFSCDHPAYGWDFDSTDSESYLSVAEDSNAYVNVTWQKISSKDSIGSMFLFSADKTVFSLDSNRIFLTANVACSTNIKGGLIVSQGKLFVGSNNANSLVDTLDTLGWTNVKTYNWKNIGIIYYYPIQKTSSDMFPSQIQTADAIHNKFDFIAKQAVLRDSNVVLNSETVNWDVNGNGVFDLYNGGNNPELDTIVNSGIAYNKETKVNIFHIRGTIRDNWRTTNNLVGSRDTTIPAHDSIIQAYFTSQWEVLRSSYYDTTYTEDSLGNEIIYEITYYPDSGAYVQVYIPADTIYIQAKTITLSGDKLLRLESLTDIETGIYYLSVDGASDYETINIISVNTCIGDNCVQLLAGVKNYYTANTATLWKEGVTNAFHKNNTNYILLSDNSSDILTTIVHEILHTPVVGALHDLINCPNNIMYFTAVTGKQLLQYRPLKREDGQTPDDQQWKLIHTNN